MKYLGLIWMDPFMGIVGAILVSRWSFGLIRDAGGGKNVVVANYVAAGKITSGGTPNVIHYHDPDAELTVITTVPPAQAITAMTRPMLGLAMTFSVIWGRSPAGDGER